MNKPTVSGNFTAEDIHNIREWNYAMMKSGKGFTDTNAVANIIRSFPKAKYVPLRDFIKIMQETGLSKEEVEALK